MHTVQFIDEKIVLFFQAIRWGVLTHFFEIFNSLQFWHVTAAIIILYSFLGTKLFKAPVISYFLAWQGSIHSFLLLQAHYHRLRPFLTIKGSHPLMTPHGFSFPSGHATLAMAIAVVLTFHFPKFRSIFFTFAVIAGISRVYLGVYYLTDVLAGFLLGTIIGAISLVLERIILKINHSKEGL